VNTQHKTTLKAKKAVSTSRMTYYSEKWGTYVKDTLDILKKIPNQEYAYSAGETNLKANTLYPSAFVQLVCSWLLVI